MDRNRKILWFKLNGQCPTTEKKDVYVCGIRIPPQNACYFLSDPFNEREISHQEMVSNHAVTK